MIFVEPKLIKKEGIYTIFSLNKKLFKSNQDDYIRTLAIYTLVLSTNKNDSK